jgi:hypothetical protein
MLHTQNVFKKISNFLNIKEHPAKIHIQKAYFQDKDVLCDRHPPDGAYAV